MKAPADRPPLLLIKWEDAHSSNHGWFNASSMPDEVDRMVVWSTGFEARREPGRLTLAQSWGGLEGERVFADLVTVPTGMILEEKVLK